jgi:hypothetical protein
MRKRIKVFAREALLSAIGINSFGLLRTGIGLTAERVYGLNLEQIAGARIGSGVLDLFLSLFFSWLREKLYHRKSWIKRSNKLHRLVVDTLFFGCYKSLSYGISLCFLDIESGQMIMLLLVNGGMFFLTGAPNCLWIDHLRDARHHTPPRNTKSPSQN